MCSIDHLPRQTSSESCASLFSREKDEPLHLLSSAPETTKSAPVEVAPVVVATVTLVMLLVLSSNDDGVTLVTSLNDARGEGCDGEEEKGKNRKEFHLETLK